MSRFVLRADLLFQAIPSGFCLVFSVFCAELMPCVVGLGRYLCQPKNFKGSSDVSGVQGARHLSSSARVRLFKFSRREISMSHESES